MRRCGRWCGCGYYRDEQFVLIAADRVKRLAFRQQGFKFVNVALRPFAAQCLCDWRFSFCAANMRQGSSSSPPDWSRRFWTLRALADGHSKEPLHIRGVPLPPSDRNKQDQDKERSHLSFFLRRIP